MRIPPSAIWPDLTLVRHRHHHPWQQPWSRRRFMQAATGLSALSAGVGSGLLRPRPLFADGTVPPVPIPGGSPVLQAMTGTLFHIYGPGIPDFGADDDEPSTITDFNGDVGLAYISGMCRRTNRATGETRELPFINSDMRYMAGAYRGVDGQVHEGTFAFI